jgi:C1A family cysteine protease
MKATKLEKNKNTGLIYVIAVLLLIAIASIFFGNQSIGKATKAIDSKAAIEEKTTSTYLPDTTQLTEFNIPTKEQLDTTPISQTFKENTEIDLKLDKPINAFSVTGNATLLSEAGLVRIILVDADKHEYLVYEINNLLVENKKQIDFENTCEETCVFEKPITAVSMKIQVEDATLKLTSVNTVPEDKSFTEIKDIKSYKQEILKTQNQTKIEKYNSAQKSWTAGETSVSNLSYEEQKRLFTREDGTIPEYLPNLQGFLYYKGGIFTLKETSSNSKTVDDTTIQPPINPPEAEPDYILPDSWDWRNVHGENWNTSIKNQGAVGTCWAFAMMGALEAQINVYYNQHLNLNLSEQMAVDCFFNDFPGYPGSLSQCTDYQGMDYICRIAIHGIPDENCSPYLERNYDSGLYCSLNYTCSNWNERTWKNNSSENMGVSLVNLTDYKKLKDSFKKALITKGPYQTGIQSMGHSMVLVGYTSTQTNWEPVSNCFTEDEWDDEFCSNSNCISRECYTQGNTMTVCANPTDTEPYTAVYTYVCNEWPGWPGMDYRWTFQNIEIYNSEDYSCNNNLLINTPFQPTIGQIECSEFSEGISCLKKKYNPNYKSEIWIFKNSWGADWGENGYANIDRLTPGNNLQFYNFPERPYTPPTDQSYWPAGFNNTINCVDEDGDEYCNWGISEEKPSTCPSFCNAEKDCDDSNPDLLGFKSKTDLRCRYRYEIQQ